MSNRRISTFAATAAITAALAVVPAVAQAEDPVCGYRASDGMFFNPGDVAGPLNGNTIAAQAQAWMAVRGHAHKSGRRITRHQSQTTVRQSGTATIAGRLRDASGAPVVGASVLIASRPLGGTWSLCGAPRAITGPRGAWQAKVAGFSGSRTSRDLLAVTFPHPGSDAAVAASPVRLNVRGTAHLYGAKSRRVRSGARLKVTGRVDGAIPNGGAIIALQIKTPGARSYRTFQLGRTNPTGTFTSRFQLYAGSGTYRLRINVPVQAGRAHANTYSPAHTLRVR